MSATVEHSPVVPAHPAHAFLLGATVPLFLGAVLSDWAYTSTYHVQWINFPAWLIAGGLVFAVASLACSVIALVRARGRGRPVVLDFLLALALCVLGVIDALVHARDAWASMPTGLVLSVVVAVIACAACALAFSRLRAGGVR